MYFFEVELSLFAHTSDVRTLSIIESVIEKHKNEIKVNFRGYYTGIFCILELYGDKCKLCNVNYLLFWIRSFLPLEGDCIFIFMSIS